MEALRNAMRRLFDEMFSLMRIIPPRSVPGANGEDGETSVIYLIGFQAFHSRSQDFATARLAHNHITKHLLLLASDDQMGRSYRRHRLGV